jgi:hypothetical protein
MNSLWQQSDTMPKRFLKIGAKQKLVKLFRLSSGWDEKHRRHKEFVKILES